VITNRRSLIALLAASSAAAAGMWTAAAGVAAGGTATVPACSSGAVVGETLRAPSSVPTQQPFTVELAVRNCTSEPLSVTLEGRQSAPAPCFAPVIDPLAVRISPGSTYRLTLSVAGESCTGTYTVSWSVVRNNALLAKRTRHVTITG
jgi:hypothetical protein